jgi:hypothetical protein
MFMPLHYYVEETYLQLISFGVLKNLREMRIQTILCLFMTAVFCVSCKKDKNEPPPEKKVYLKSYATLSGGVLLLNN